MGTEAFAVDRRAFSAGIVGAAAFLPGGFAKAAEVPKKGGTLVVVQWPAPSILISAVSTAGPEAFLSAKIFDGLLGYGAGMKPVPQLAESWDFSADGLTLRFNLRPGVKWHDGKPFTSRDVAYSFMEISKIYHGRMKTILAGLKEVQTPDDLTAIFKLERPAPALLSSLDALDAPIMPAHLYQGTDVLKNPFNLNPVGTGPYKVTEYKRSAYVVLTKNENYWDRGLPYLDKVIVQYVADPVTRTAMMEAGQADVVFLNLMPATDMLRLAETSKFEIVYGYETTLSIHQMDFNLSSPILKNLKVRQALASAIDRDWVAKNVWYTFAVPATGPLHNDQAGFYSADGVPSYPYDLKKAERLLDEAGYPRARNGVRFTMTIDASSYGDESRTAAQYIREQFRQIGVATTVRSEDFGVFVKRIWTDRDFDMALYTAGGVDPTVGTERFYSSKSIQKGVAYSNGSGYSNPEVDRVLEAASIEMDSQKRRALFVEFQRLAMADIPTLPIVAIRRATLANKKVRQHTLPAVGGFGNLANCWLNV